MTANSYLGQVGQWNSEPSLPELLFREFIGKRITERDYNVGTAVWVADNLGKYQPSVYPQMASPIRDYIRDRTDERIPREPARSFRLGRWTFQVKSAHVQNGADELLLRWCIEKLSGVKLTTAVADVESQVRRFTISLPQDWGPALWVQAKDARDKELETRRS